MRRIKHLPESVHSSVRSGIFLFDLTRVVEELIFNSLDAGASKVSVSVGVGTCFVKVVDNGTGITRDGLVLLGERYATSKVDQSEDMNAVTGGFGFRGEALSSISDVSLLEIVTKSHGRPNGYRKVIKGCKCLYLGIDDGRQDVGTTVNVRDLFYNQPVRRKQMHSSSKKVLHSVKNCALRIALVHPKVLFEVVDIESEDELLCTCPSPSPLSLLTSGFGVDVSKTLHELNVSHGVLKLQGYVSAPCDTFSTKDFQYIYINSRYICKGPLQKLLNQLATRFNYSDLWMGNIGSESRKRSRSQTYVTYILNLSCPRSCYAITFESSKTSVEFKDWAPILNFVEESVVHFWSKNTSHGNSQNSCVDMSTTENMCKEGDNTVSYEEDFPKEHGIAKKKRRVQIHQSSFGPPSPQLEMLTEESIFSGWVSQRKNSEFKEHCTTGAGFVHQADYPYQSCDDPFAQFRMKVNPEDDIFGKKKSSVPADDVLGYRWDDLSVGATETASAWSSPRHMIKSDLHRDLDFLSRDSVKLSPIGGECSADENDLLLSDSLTGIGEFGSRHQSVDFDWCSETSDLLFGTETPDIDQFAHGNGLERHGLYNETAEYVNWTGREGKGSFLSCETLLNSPSRRNWSFAKCTNISSDYKVHTDSEEDIFEFLHGPNLGYVFSPKRSYPCTNEIGRLHSGSSRKNVADEVTTRSHHHSTPIYLDKDTVKIDQCAYQEENYVCRKGSKRSQSAPPVYRGRKKFLVLNNPLTTEARKPDAQTFIDTNTLRENSELKHLQPSCAVNRLHAEPSFGKDKIVDIRPDTTPDVLETEECEIEKKSKGVAISNTKSVEDQTSKEQMGEDFISREIQDPLDSGLKWRNNCPQIANGNKTHNPHNEDYVLDISSGLLHLAGESLVPKSVSKKFLNKAKVLQQVDKKFIPVVAGGVLAIIDQHAADERIRLEELRQKVLSREMRTITYLDAEQELVLPEMGYQLLHNYAEQIQTWGWICNVHTQDSKSFKKNLNLLHRHQSVVKLLAVPCILGVKLTDIDLLEFLQQLADTDGSSTMPPSVLRVLNFKACRGAIMFGDTLLPSECSLIVEELKQTSLCLQCAHGRPTTAPLVSLGALRKQLAKLGSWNGGPNELWHGLRRHEVSLERAALRLSSSG